MYTVHIIQPTSNCQQMVLSHGRQAGRQTDRQTDRKSISSSDSQSAHLPVRESAKRSPKITKRSPNVSLDIIVLLFLPVP